MKNNNRSKFQSIYHNIVFIEKKRKIYLEKGYCIEEWTKFKNLYLETNQITKIVRAKISSTIHFASTTPLILVSFLYARTVANKRSRSQSCKEERDERTRKVSRSNRATNRHVRFNKFPVDMSWNCECIMHRFSHLSR